MSRETKRRWRDYRTAAGRRPIKEFIDGLSDVDAAAVVAAMKDVRETGLVLARHLRGEIYEVRADGDRQTFRILFALEGQRSQIVPRAQGVSRRLAEAGRDSTSAMRCHLRYRKAHGE